MIPYLGQECYSEHLIWMIYMANSRKYRGIFEKLSLYKDVHLQMFKCVSFWLHGCCGEWEGWPVNQANHTSWVAVVTPTDRPKSVRDCCLIELFCGVVCVVTLPFWHFCWCRGFCHRTGSDLLLFVNISKGRLSQRMGIFVWRTWTLRFIRGKFLHVH